MVALTQGIPGNKTGVVVVDKSRDHEGLILAPHLFSSPAAPQACSQPSSGPQQSVGTQPTLQWLLAMPSSVNYNATSETIRRCDQQQIPALHFLPL